MNSEPTFEQEWAAQELKEVNALLMPTTDNHCNLCRYCDQLLATDFHFMLHQPGYRALKISASKCSLCYIIFHAFDREIEEGQFYSGSRQWSKEMETHDVIQLAVIPEETKTHEYLKRVNCHWAGGSSRGSFRLNGDTVAIYRLRPEEKRLKPVLMTSYDLNARLETIGDWIKLCLSSHKCSDLDYDTQTPTRLLDLEPSTTGNFIRLVHANNINARYAALSHCWGTGRPLTTLTKSLASNMQGIEFRKLPQMFQEVVQVLRHLQIRYLWIDTLCIVQDDTQDWEQESAKMCQIYRNAFVCIAALAARDCKQPLIYDFRTSFIDQNSGYACRVVDWHCKEGVLPLDQRAWAFQEILLSRRLLLFGKRQISWHCYGAHLCEDDFHRSVWQPGETTRTSNKNEFDNLVPEDVEQIYECWQNIASEYSSRMITYDDDRLPALAGITTHFQSLLNDEPLVGLWRNHFVQGLAWKALPGASRNINRGIPTWSWLSVKGLFQYQQYVGTYAHLDPALRLCDATISWSGTPLSSTIASSTVTVEGSLSPVILSPEQSSRIDTTGYFVLEMEDGASVRDVTLDNGAGTIPSDLYCAHLATTRSQDPINGPFDRERLFVLLLQPSTAAENTFLRIGIGELGPSRNDSGLNDISLSKLMPRSYHTRFSLA
ncbi:heterokaryon incompatibility protein-domain-containing protein [Lophiotrema nucula]|uniref:Heterokaryon incompatibility protein-domain-containing protein n=1 Tax=Lophiotrema nucula TaxID=690887 RepID=A0A6A5YUZ5_9PLEO|nr:heterokaryon incompatibility protein-domain-containing protein [Lophiotrema nucula]